MERRNRAAAAIACAALLVLIGAGCARCAMVHGGAQEEAQQEQAAEQGAEVRAQDEAEDSLGKLVGTKWTSEDGKSTLAILSGAFVETAGGEEAVTYWTAGDAKPDSGGFSETVWAGEALTGKQSQTVVRVDVPPSGRMSVSCDSFKKSGKYLADAADGSALSVKGDVSRLAEIAGADGARIAEALQAFAESKAPYAASASWDGEVYIDANANTTSSTFTLDDPNKTVVTVTVDGATGEISAM